MLKFIFILFSAFNSNLKGKKKANNREDFFRILHFFGKKSFSKKYFDIRFELDPMNSTVSSRILLENDFEKLDLENFLTLIPNEGVCLDIGGNIGLYSCIISRNKPGLKVYTFEPANHVFQILLRNTDSFPNIFPINVGIGETNSVSAFYEFEDDALSSFVNSDRSKLKRVSKAFVINGDKFLDLYGIEDVTSIKIDVEGFELSVLKGLKLLLEKNNPIIQIELIHNNPQTSECHDLLLKFGYICHYWRDNVLETSEFLIEDFYNYIYIKKEK